MSDFLIIGGGIIGLLSARALSQRGATVTVVDAQRLGQAASWAGGGIISPLYPWRYSDFITQLAKTSQILYPPLAAALFEETGIDIELIRSGMLLLATQDKKPALAWGEKHHVQLEYVSSATVKNLQPDLGLVADALWMPEVMQVRNPRLLQALIVSLKQSGVRIIENQAIVKINHQAQRITCVETAQQSLSAAQIIVTAGAWSGQLLRSLGIDLAITPVKGQMLLLAPQKQPLTKMVLYRQHYLIPRKDGQILVGSTLEYQAGFNQIPTQAAFNELYQAATALLPSLKTATVMAQWAGSRPYAAEGMPLIGQVTPYVNLYLHAGHFRNGLVLAPGAVAYFLENNILEM